MQDKSQKRCFGDGPGKEFYAEYHDGEWGIPSFDDRYLFEMLSLEGAQAGLSWETVLKRRSGYRECFHNFEPQKVASMSDCELELLAKDPRIIRHAKKVHSVKTNAKIFLEIQKEFGSFSNYLWGYVNHTPIVNRWKTFDEVPAETPLSKEISKDLKRRGMTFVGPTIIYAYMQAVGLVNDHLNDCICST